MSEYSVIPCEYPMSTTEHSIRTTHVGSLPRPPELVDLFERAQQGESIDEERFRDLVADATRKVVQRQADIGIDIANNGEQPRIAFNFYAANRLSGFDGESTANFWADLEDYPSYAEKAFDTVDVDLRTRPAATAPVTYVGEDAARGELAGFKQALEAVDADFEATFITAASPGVVATSLGNEYYDSYDEFVFAVAEAMAEEYTLLAEETDGYLQVDSGDLWEYHRILRDLSDEEYLEAVRTHIEALNQALDGIPAERVRYHACWGNYEGPHHKDIPLETVLPEIYEAEVGTISIEQANPRHQHEYRAFEEYPLPDEWALMPGVIDTKTNMIEPPEVVADRIERFADIVGDPTRIIAAPDCGFGTLAGLRTVDSEVAWAKLESMVKGAELASERLF